ncbi:MAG: thioredoxin domain-containing protein [Bacteroides sp.]|nr:thioredoxin domain-containing protein [Bacteroides sp.]
MEEHAHTNALVNETSPYLLQHAHNPVNWYPWGEEALEKAQKEGKLIIVSIGYSSCHWCHVMEHESFEDSTVAQLMNDHFVCIKVDREERPDIDHIYMTAVHLLNQQGGWPLNCIALPDGRPIWGGTYFPKAEWMNALTQVNDFHQSKPEETEQYAQRLAEGIAQNSIYQTPEVDQPLTKTELSEAVVKWSGQFDLKYGGHQGAPKFPMPVNMEFLLQYGFQQEDQEILDFVSTTLTMMARGGIYDQAGGGFSRYSVDPIWKVPHFEKMLYDNAQLIGLYSMAYQVYGDENYRRVVDQSVEFIAREMTNNEGSFFSALDADSEGVEGKFYVWNRQELEEVLKGDFDLFSEYYNINETGLWEHGNYILYRTQDPDTFAGEQKMDPKAFKKRIDKWNDLLLEARSERIRPGLDDKSLTSWNALMISGLVKSYRATGQEGHLEMAINCGNMIRDKMWSKEKVLYRNFKEGRVSIPGFHIDYALSIEACLDLYESSMDSEWLEFARELTEASLEKFYDKSSGMFRYSSDDAEILISHHMEIQDNVIPSSNSVMANSLFRLGQILVKKEYLNLATKMVDQMSPRIGQYPNGFAGWGRLLLKQLHPFYEVAIVGPDAAAVLSEMQSDYLPQIVVAASTRESDLPLFKGRYTKDKTHIFVCRDNVCQLPVEDLKDAKAIYHNQ